jgi:hypothetical protein
VKSDKLAEQIGMFDNGSDKRRQRLEKRESAIDTIREKFGSSSIVRASVIDSDIGVFETPKNKNKKEAE